MCLTVKMLGKNAKADTNQQSQQMNIPYQDVATRRLGVFGWLFDFGSIHIILHNTLISLHHTINRKKALIHTILFTHTYQSNNNGKPFRISIKTSVSYCCRIASKQATTKTTEKRQIVSGISNTNVENYVVDTFDCVTFERRLKMHGINNMLHTDE